MKLDELSSRDRQIVEVIFGHGASTAREVMDALPDPPGYSATRSMLSRLVGKGVLERTKQGHRWVYDIRTSKERIVRRELKRLVNRFFDGSTEAAVLGLLGTKKEQLSEEEQRTLQALLDRKP